MLGTLLAHQIMAIKVRLDLIKQREGRSKQTVFREKPESDISVNNFASKLANEIYGEVSKPFLEIFKFLESKNLITDEVAEKIFDERDRLFLKFEAGEFQRKFIFKTIGRERGISNSQTPVLSKSDFFKKLNDFIRSHFNEYDEKPSQKLASKQLGFQSEKTFKRKRVQFGDDSSWTSYCKNILKME